MDFLITAGNPLEDLRALRKPRMVVTRGVRIDKPAIKKSEEIEHALDGLRGITYEELSELL